MVLPRFSFAAILLAASTISARAVDEILRHAMERGDPANRRLADGRLRVHPIVDIGFGQNGGAIFAPAARFARNLGDNLSLGIEYYTDLGPLQNWSLFNEQQHNIYAVVDSRLGASM